MMPVMTKKNEVWFIDMDGTIVEWRMGMDHMIRTPGYFRTLRPTTFLAPVREFAAAGGEAYILGSYLEGCQALWDKHEWLDEHLPEVPVQRRLFIPCGRSKAEAVMKLFGLDVLTGRMVLFDDFSKNLHEWKTAGGKGIKCRNGINGSYGTWTGDSVMWSQELREALGAAA